MNDNTLRFSGVWDQIRQWPSRERLALASRILASLQTETEIHEASDERRSAIKNLIGIWKHASPPDDNGVREIVEQERMKKYR